MNSVFANPLGNESLFNRVVSPIEHKQRKPKFVATESGNINGSGVGTFRSVLESVFQKGNLTGIRAIPLI